MRWNCRHEASEQQWLKQIKMREKKKMQKGNILEWARVQWEKRKGSLCIHFKFQVVWLDSYDP